MVVILGAVRLIKITPMISLTDFQPRQSLTCPPDFRKHHNRGYAASREQAIADFKAQRL